MTTVDQLMSGSGEWLSGAGPRCEIVISSRIRYARNLAGYPFLPKATASQAKEIHRFLAQRITESPFGGEALYFDIEHTPNVDRQILVERHLISRQHADGHWSRGAAISKHETFALMINEEDHLRMQVLAGGLQLEKLQGEIDRIDDCIERKVEYAFDKRYGYLTACPTNVGTGIRVSVMLHLPALKLTGEIERVFRAARDMRLAIRGLHGEGTDATGDFYQVSNQTTLGKPESEIVDEFRGFVVPKIIDYEERARQVLLKEKPSALEDKIWRAYGVLTNARAISTEESLYMLSHVRLGVHLGRLERVNIRTVNELFLHAQPAHLQKLCGRTLDGEERSIARADLLRRRLANNN